MRLAAIVLATLCATGAAEAAPRAKLEPSTSTLITPGWSAPGSNVRIHRGSRAPRPSTEPAAGSRAHVPVVVVIRRGRPLRYSAYPERDWTAERFGQSDWSGRSFGFSDFGRGPWGDYGPN